jgi:hypothetical protein
MVARRDCRQRNPAILEVGRNERSGLREATGRTAVMHRAAEGAIADRVRSNRRGSGRP